MNRVVKLIFLLIVSSSVVAQKLNLQQCIDTAIASNILIKQNNLLMQREAINWNQARLNRLPDLSANFNHGLNQGRSIDPSSNDYVNQQINYANYNLSSGIILFNGMNQVNTVKQTAYAYEASKMEWQQAKDNLTLNVILSYLQVLNNEDIVVSSSKQAELSQKQLERLEVLDKQGAITPSLVSDLRGQLMNDQLTILNAKNQLEISKLTLAQYMNIPYSKDMQLERINVNDLLTAYMQSANEIFENATHQFALIKSVELRKRSAEYAMKASRGELSPTVILSGNMGTNYSSAARSATGKIPYNEQLNNNMSSGVGIGLRIPIFNSFSARNRVKLANLDWKNAQLVEENTKVLLRQQIEQAHLNMNNAYERYKTLQLQVEAYQQSFRAAEAKFNAGVGTTVDYLIAKNNLDRANINLISAQYDFVLRKKVLDYYQNIK
jgi:outer membrane protein